MTTCGESMLANVLQRLAQAKGDWPRIADESAVPYQTITKIACGFVCDPRVSTVQALYDYFQARDRGELHLEASSKTPERGCLLPRQAVNLGHQNNGSPRMEAPIIDDELWILIEPLLPPAKLRAKSDPGRPRVSDRAALNGILFVFKTGIRWNHLPTRLGFGSGATCWRRLSDWQKAGVWDQLHELLLDKLRAAGQIDLSYAAVDSSSVRAVGAGEKLARTPLIARDPVPSTTSS